VTPTPSYATTTTAPTTTSTSTTTKSPTTTAASTTTTPTTTATSTTTKSPTTTATPTTTTISTKTPASTTAAPTKPPTPTLKPGCINVSVVGDATYCVTGPICGDEGNNCPKKGDFASQDCFRHLGSFNGDWCVAKSDAVCQKIKSGARGCVFSA
ncbi:hypothetical protein As57867_018895, partial [Aphanomyces stellatus]